MPHRDAADTEHTYESVWLRSVTDVFTYAPVVSQRSYATHAAPPPFSGAASRVRDCDQALSLSLSRRNSLRRLPRRWPKVKVRESGGVGLNVLDMATRESNERGARSIDRRAGVVRALAYIGGRRWRFFSASVDRGGPPWSQSVSQSVDRRNQSHRSLEKISQPNPFRIVSTMSYRYDEDLADARLNRYYRALVFFGANGEWSRFLDTVVAFGYDVNATNLVLEETPLHLASRRDSLSTAKTLIENLGARPYVQNSLGFTPLDLALFSGSTDCAKFLIGLGAWGPPPPATPPSSSSSSSSSGGETTTSLSAAATIKNAPPTKLVTIAAAYCDIEMVDLLVRAGADPALPDPSGQIPLQYALWRGTAVEARYFMRFGMARHGDDVGDTPLHYLALRGAANYVNVVVANDDNGRPPIRGDEDDAAEGGLDAADYGGPRGPLALNDFADLASQLASRGADLDARNAEGSTPLDYCSTNREAAWLLLCGATPSPLPPYADDDDRRQRRLEERRARARRGELDEDDDDDDDHDLAAAIDRSRSLGGRQPQLARCLSEIERLGLTMFGFNGMSLRDLLFLDSHELARFARNPKLANLATGRADDAFDATNNFPICSPFLARQRDRAQSRRRLLEGASRFLSERALASKLIRPRLHEPLYLDVLRHLGNRQLLTMARAVAEATTTTTTADQDDDDDDDDDHGQREA